MLEADALNTFYGSAHVLFDVSLRVGTDECVALLGRNGAGKTTLLRTLMNLTPPRSGTVRLADEPLMGLPPFQVARRGLGFVPDARRIFPTLTVEQNLDMGAKAGAGGARTWTRERVYEVFPKLRLMRARGGENLSGGEQQMLTIARTLMGNPRVLLLDEPTEGLAPIIVRDLVEIIRRLKAEGMTIVLVEQNANVALSLADRCYVFDHGRVVHEGTPEAISADGQLLHDLLGV